MKEKKGEERKKEKRKVIELIVKEDRPYQNIEEIYLKQGKTQAGNEPITLPLMYMCFLQSTQSSLSMTAL